MSQEQLNDILLFNHLESLLLRLKKKKSKQVLTNT